MTKIYSLIADCAFPSKRSSCLGIGIIAAALSTSKALGPRKEKASENLIRWPFVSCLQRPGCTFEMCMKIVSPIPSRDTNACVASSRQIFPENCCSGIG